MSVVAQDRGREREREIGTPPPATMLSTYRGLLHKGIVGTGILLLDVFCRANLVDAEALARTLAAAK